MGWLGSPYIFSGFGVGFIVGLTGVGGGSLMTPLPVLGSLLAPRVPERDLLLLLAILLAAVGGRLVIS